MNGVFLWLLNKLKSGSKYFIFMPFFLFTFVLANVSGVRASDLFDAGLEFAPNNKTDDATNADYRSPMIAGLDAGANRCVTSSRPDNNAFSNQLLSSTYDSKTVNCVSYLNRESYDSSTHNESIFYIESLKKASGTKTLLTFKVTTNTNQLNQLHTYITVGESSYFSGAHTNYDLYMQTATPGTYQKYTVTRDATSGVDVREIVAGSTITATIEGTVYTYTFNYTIRNDNYGLHHLNINFYTGDPNTNASTATSDIVYVLAAPISGFQVTKTVRLHNESSFAAADACGVVDSICVLYKKNAPYSGSGDRLTTNNIKVLISKNAAIYFSTYYTHNITAGSTYEMGVDKGDAANYSAIKHFNTIYAKNTFFNEGELGNANAIEYYYYDAYDYTRYQNFEINGVQASTSLTPNDVYNEGATHYADSAYRFELIIDASGKYTIYVRDIFGNEKTIDVLTNDDVNDLSNRELSILYLKYTPIGVDAATDTNPADFDASLTVADHGFNVFEGFLVKSLSDYTNLNVIVGTEYYYEIQVLFQYGIHARGTIKKNPLVNGGTGGIVQELGTTKVSSWCRDNYVSENLQCMTTGSYTQRTLVENTSISANDSTGLKQINHTPTFRNGKLSDAQKSALTIATGTRANRTNYLLNENGRFIFVVQDEYGNNTTSYVDVTIIDQYKPLIYTDITTLVDSIYNNTICSSMYVIGGGNTVHTYPQTQLTECSSNSVSYSHFSPLGLGVNTSSNEIIELFVKTGITDDGIDLAEILANTDDQLNTRGFYNPFTNSVSFTYLDAIRMALIRTTDEITYHSESSPAKNNRIKSQYLKNNDTYTEFKLHTNSAIVGDNAFTVIDANDERSLFAFDGTNNPINQGFAQNASELKRYLGVDNTEANQEYLRFRVYNSAGVASGNLVCDSLSGTVKNQTCYDIVNMFIDKTYSFYLVFNSQDHAGNTSLDFTVKINVEDDTTPGLADYDELNGKITYPEIPVSNTYTGAKCRLQAGSKIQTKRELLECYKIKETTNDTNGKLYFLDNKAYDNGSIKNPSGNTISGGLYSTAIWHEQLWDRNTNKYSHISIFICTVEGESGCADGNNYQEVTENSTSDAHPTLSAAGNYRIKFVIKDFAKDSLDTTTVDQNETTIILLYYVNPKILLIRPQETVKVYGEADPTIHYCLYATTNNAIFDINVFNPGGSDTTHSFVHTYYETGANEGIKYCTGGFDDGTTAASKTLAEVLSASVDEAGSIIQGSLYRTYATGDNRYKIGNEDTKFYEDAGYYYITMGDMKINDTTRVDASNPASPLKYANSYVLRLHPDYVGGGVEPNVGLISWNNPIIKGSAIAGETSEQTTERDIYKYGNNDVRQGEAISNVVYTIKQKELVVNANGGSKLYGQKDTNYLQYANGTASDNISAIFLNNGTNTSATATSDYTSATKGYLNGFTITGLVDRGVATTGDRNKNVNDLALVSQIVSGSLRRVSGEHAGIYNICIMTETTGNMAGMNAITTCHNYTLTQNVLTVVNLSDSAISIYSSFTASSTSSKTSTELVDYLGLYFSYNGGERIRLTRNNLFVDGGTLKIRLTLESRLWEFATADGAIKNDDNHRVKIIANGRNANKNYYITYNDNTYTINPNDLVVQPGYNQGKEYSNPEKSDPIFEIVVYNEIRGITGEAGGILGSDTAWNGYTETIVDVSYPYANDATGRKTNDMAKYNEAPYTNRETSVYYDERRSETLDLGTITYEYQYEVNAVSSVYTIEGVDYRYSANQLCSVKDSSECYAVDAANSIHNGLRFTYSDSKIIVILTGALTRETFELFANANGAAGTGKINRDRSGTNPYEVGWYEYSTSTTLLHAIPRGLNNCSVTSEYVYSIGGTSQCADYNREFVTDAGEVVDGNKVITRKNNNTYDYKHNLSDVCTNEDVYTAVCSNTKDIQFLIFKRDLIITFAGFLDTYGMDASQVATAAFTVPTVYEKNANVVCFRKVSGSGGYSGPYAGNYELINDTQCATDDYGITSNDTWSGIGFRFYLHKSLNDYFDGDHYVLPSGRYHVYAQIGSTNVGTETVGGYQKTKHPNYRLVYIDYTYIKAKETENRDVSTAYNAITTQKGALDIAPRPVDLTGTYYQKEFGQAAYKTYDNNGAALATTNNKSGVQTQLLANTFATHTLYDNYYYYCDGSVYETTNSDGCWIADETNNSHTSNNAKYYYSNIANIYGYIGKAIDGNDKSGIVDRLTSAKVDEFFNNFSGTPVRSRPDSVQTGDVFGLLDPVGYYEISLSDISAVIAMYRNGTGASSTEFVLNEAVGTILRDENYQINTVTSGRLYITPAQINIELPTGTQTKMYGCAYNTHNTANTTYTYGSGYANCEEGFAKNYDTGYKYIVSGDKRVSLMNANRFSTWKVAGYDASIVNKHTHRRDLQVSNDIDYDNNAIISSSAPTGTKYEVEPSNDNIGTTYGKHTNTSLNTGTLIRLPATGTETSYAYGTTYTFANSVQAVESASTASQVFQKQSVGTYVITLGNLDASANVNAHCGEFSVPGAGTSKCKDFVLNYQGYNTSAHVVSASNTDTFEGLTASTDDFKVTNSNVTFTITTRHVVAVTEYNYKVVGDTDPHEGFNCGDLANMYVTSPFASATGFSYADRSYCSAATDFINGGSGVHTGVARFYAITNTLAKAPWTAWTDAATAHSNYSDAQFDVFATTSKVNRAGEGANPAQNDKVGKYELSFDLSLNTSLNGNNYTIAYLDVSAGSEVAASTTYTETATVTGYVARNASALTEGRWYGDSNHICNTATGVCPTYTGTEYFDFVIKGFGITPDANNDNRLKTAFNYKATDVTTSNAIYRDASGAALTDKYIVFEIVKREIYLKTEDQSKIYGVEEEYTDFEVKLCVEDVNNAGEFLCEPNNLLTKAWGQRASLSNADYQQFYVTGVANPSGAIKGEYVGSYLFGSTPVNATNDATIRAYLRGVVAQRAFGVYFYRTPGEEVNTYTIVACPTQSENDVSCNTYYEDQSLTAGQTGNDASVGRFDVSYATSSTYNASNYIVNTIPGTLTINPRPIVITPDAGQGFMYGNYETGNKIPPITYTETYTPTGGSAISGLVNGSVIAADDVNNQSAYCIYNISITTYITCINDRQNTVGLNTTTTYKKSSIRPDITASSIDTWVVHNVYNDTYTVDNDAATSRNALDRVMGASTTSQRYNRNVGVYTIVAGELDPTTHIVCNESRTSDCLNKNYTITGFTSGVTYEITPATIVVTPVEGQSKVYGENDVHLKFTVKSTTTIDAPNLDTYYTHANVITKNTTCTTVGANCEVDGYFYEENSASADVTNGYNYGLSKVSNKSDTHQGVTSIFSAHASTNPKYYDKYCYNYDSTACDSFDATNRYVSLTYGETQRILLGYFYVDKWHQRADTYTIMNGIVVAYNEFGNTTNGYKNYTYDVAMDAATSVNFTINKMKITAQISPVTKVYGQASDAYKCDEVNASIYDINTQNCGTGHAVLTSADNENKLEYNFNVIKHASYNAEGKGINEVDNKILLTTAVSGKYYTQTSLAEYKNIHLGLLVTRELATSTCLYGSDKYGCEDAGTYDLTFRKIDVDNFVDDNYEVYYRNGEDTVSSSVMAFVSSSDYLNTAIIEETSARNETEGIIVSNDKTTYNNGVNTTKYSIVSINGTSVRTVTASANINVMANPDITLVINKRPTEIYIGTYADDGTVEYRYIIEQNEQVPELPRLEPQYTRLPQAITTIQNPKQVHHTTWYNNTSYSFNVSDSTYLYRQVRTVDILQTELSGSGSDLVQNGNVYGIYLCKTPLTSTQTVDDITYTSCGTSNVIKYESANNIVNISGNNTYAFPTDIVGTYAILRDRNTTYIAPSTGLIGAGIDYENKNYTHSSSDSTSGAKDKNGTLVVFEDTTAPIIQIGNDTFVMEANADTVVSGQSGCVVNTFGSAFSNECKVKGKLFTETTKSLGQIIEYLTTNYSNYGSATSTIISQLPTEYTKSDYKAPNTTQGIENGIHGYYPVNNIGLVSPTDNITLYTVQRNTNTYDFDDVYINSDLSAISSIISWFNINSYDYSYIRGNNYVQKRYTPRYNIYIGTEDNAFDPTYVGDFTITISVIDEVGNYADTTVTLRIVDTTAPEIGEMYVFNEQVVCGTQAQCLATSDSIDGWYVQAGFKKLNSFKRYSQTAPNTYVEDNENGGYIHLNNAYVSIYSVSKFNSDGTANFLGEYVEVEERQTLALEVEHRFWQNSPNKYVVVVGGKDNSYIAANEGVANTKDSQWHTYIRLHSVDSNQAWNANWYQYNRHRTDGMPINVSDGRSVVYARVVDSGRDYSMAITNGGYTYYNEQFLIPDGSTCSAPGCTQITDAEYESIQVQTTIDENGKFIVHGIEITRSGNTLTWAGGSANIDSNSFTFGSLICTIDGNNVSCRIRYDIYYSNISANKHKVTINIPTYTILESSAGNDYHNTNVLSTVNTTSGFNTDRRLVFVDTTNPTVALKDSPYATYEFDSSCSHGVEDDICESPFKDEGFETADSYNSKEVTEANSGLTSPLTGTKLATINTHTPFVVFGATGATTIRYYKSGTDYEDYVLTSKNSGVLTTNTLISAGLGGAEEGLTTDATNKFNKTRVEAIVYATAEYKDKDSKQYAVRHYRFIPIYDAAAGNYKILYQIKANVSDPYNVACQIGESCVSVITGQNPTTLLGTSGATYTQGVLDYIVSTASINAIDPVIFRDQLAPRATFSVNYYLRDVAGNKNVGVTNVTVRGTTFIKLSSYILTDIVVGGGAGGASIQQVGDNSYAVSLNQGVSFTQILPNFSITNVDNNGNDVSSSVVKTVSYNGVVKDNINIENFVFDKPGVYTLTLTNRRQVNSERMGTIYVEDKPLTITFEVLPLVAKITNENANSKSLVNPILFATFMVSLTLISIVIYKRKKEEK